MNPITHDHAAVRERDRAVSVPAGATSRTSTRPRWLVPALVVAVVAVALVAGGYLSFSSVLYAGVFGGMILMHVGGHGGHGGHGSQGGHAGSHTGGVAGDDDGAGHTGQAAGSNGDDDLRNPSAGAQVRGSRSDDESADVAPATGLRNETREQDRNTAHRCH